MTPFRIDDLFNTAGCRAIVTGVASAPIHVGDRVRVAPADGRVERRGVVVGLEWFRREVSEVPAGARVGVLVDGIRRRELVRGEVLELTRPG